MDEETSLRWATRNTLSGLGWLAGSLGKPQRALWGTVNGLTGGDWGGGGPLNLIPFSDTVGLTDPSMERSGSTVLERTGVIPKNTPGFDWWDVPRFGVDVATDPLTYVGGAGAFGKAGAAAKGTGFVDDAVRSTMARTGMGFRRSAAATTGRDVLKYASSVGHGRPATRAFVERARQLGVRARELADQPIGGVGFRLPGTLGSAYRGPGAAALETALDAPGQFFRNVRRSAVGASAADLVDKAAQGAERNRFAEEAVGQFGEGARDMLREHDAYAVRFAQAGSGTTDDYYRRLRAETVDAGNAAKPMGYSAKMKDGSTIPVDISPEGHYVDQMGRRVADDAVEEIGPPTAGATDTLLQGGDSVKPPWEMTKQELDATRGPVPEGHVRLWRAESGAAPGKVSDWLKETPEYQNSVGASGRWFVEQPEMLKFYADDAGDGYRLAFRDVPASEVEKFRVSNIASKGGKEVAENPLPFSRDPANEFFLPPAPKPGATDTLFQGADDALVTAEPPPSPALLKLRETFPDHAKYIDDLPDADAQVLGQQKRGGGLYDLHEMLRAGHPGKVNERTVELAANLNRVVENAPLTSSEVVVYRSMPNLGETMSIGGADIPIQKLKVGDEVTVRSPVATSMSDYWLGADKPNIPAVEIRVPAGSRGLAIDATDLKYNPRKQLANKEAEFVIPAGSKLKVVGERTLEGGKKVLQIDVVGHSPANIKSFKDLKPGDTIGSLSLRDIGEDGAKFTTRLANGKRVAVDRAADPVSLFQKARGAVTFDDAAKTAVIKAFRGTSDISTFVHESAHVFRRWLDEVDPELLDELTKHFGMKSGAKWTREAEEKFAEAFEKYIAEGKAPKGFLQKSFDRLKEFLEEVYAGIKGSPLEKELDPKLKEAFDRMLSPADSPGVWTNSKIGNVARGLFDAPSGGRFDRVGQEVNQIADAAMRRDGPKIAETFDRMVESIRQPFKDFEEWFGPGFNNVAKGGMREGDRVSVAGRQGEINRLMPNTAEVYFRNPKDGLEEWKRVPLSEIVADTGKALQSSRLYSSFGKIAEAIGEGVDPDQAIKLVEEAMKLRPGTLTSRTLTDKVRNGMIEAAQKLQMERDTPFGSWLAKGGQSNFLDNHVPRAPDGGDIASISASRQAITKSIPGIVINKMMVDKSLRGDPVAAAQALMDKYITPGIAKLNNDYVSALRKDATGKQATGAQVHLEDLVGYINDHDKKWMYIRDFMANNARYTRDVVRANAIADGVHEMVKRSATTTGDVSLRQLFLSSSLDPDRALAWHSKLTGKSVAELEKLRVPLEVATGLSGIAQLQGNKEWFNVVTKAIDKFHKLFKEAVTIQPAFIGYFTRNHAGGQFMNMASGNIDGVKDVLAYSKEYGRAVKEIKNGFKDVSKEELKEIQRYRVLGDTGFEGVEHYQAAPPDPLAWGDNVDQVRPGNPRAVRETLREARQDVASSPTSLGEFTGKYPRIGGAIERGTDKVRTAWQANVRTGSKMNTNVEWLNRVTYFRFLRKKGFSAKAAADEVHKAHFDYSRLAPFERDVMKRAIPFYSFSRRMAEALFENLMERPGGAMAQTLAASAGVAEPGTPDHVATTAAIPMGELPDGSKRYLTGFGMPYEDTAGFFSGGVRGALLEGLSRSSPLIKGPMEWATGESFFQTGPGGGRDLLDADPPIGRAISNIAGWKDPVRLPEGIEHIAANLPTSRYTTLLRTMTDQRKGYGARASQLLTGVRITDVSPAAQDAVLREHLTDAARRAGAGAFERVSFRAGDGEELTPDQQQLQNALNALARRAKQRKKKKEGEAKK